MFTPEIGTPLELLDTPCLVVDAAIMEANMKSMFDSTRYLGLNVRPHLKTAKSPTLARELIEAGARGICVAKLSEAEIMFEAGVTDILITTEIVGEPKQSRLVSLAKRNPELRIVVDNTLAAEQLNERLAKCEHQVMVLIDVNVGQNRTGVNTKEEALALAQKISELPQLQLIGLQGYEGHLQMWPDEKARRQKCHEACRRLLDVVAHLEECGFPIRTVTTGGTGTYMYCSEVEGITEVQPGSFLFMDLAYQRAGVLQFRQALHVLATVISKPNATLAVVDAGMKSLSTDSGNAAVNPRWTNMSYVPAGDEHGIVESTDGKALKVSLGDKILFAPSHIDTTVNLYDHYCIMRNNRLESICKISARGKIQ